MRSLNTLQHTPTSIAMAADESPCISREKGTPSLRAVP